MTSFSATPYPANSFRVSSKALTELCDQIIEDTQEALRLIVQRKGEHSFENTIEPMQLAYEVMWDRLAPLHLLGYVSENDSVRKAAKACELKAGKFEVDLRAREDLFRVFQQAAQKNQKTLKGEDLLLLKSNQRDFKKNGLMLSKKKREELVTLRKQIAELEVKYQNNLQEDVREVAFSPEEMAGLPKDFVGRFPKNKDGKHVLTTSYPDYFPFMKEARSSEARKRFFYAFARRGGEQNIQILQKAIDLRHQAANLLGYATHADLQTEGRMLNSAKKVEAFLKKLETRFQKRRDQDLKKLLALKKKDKPKAKKVWPWDRLYYENQILKSEYGIDSNEIRKFFPLNVVTKGMLATYELLFGLQFKEIKPAQAWHKDVQLFEVHDLESEELIGHFYLDLFPRSGKYQHAAVFPLRARLLKNGKIGQHSAAAMVANFSKPTPTKPSLLTHDEVETFFHEFGHVMHALLAKSKYYRFTGIGVTTEFGVPDDFGEAPSTMLENWVWNTEVLQNLSGHFENPRRKLPRQLISKMTQARQANSGTFYPRQIFLARVDLAYHTNPKPEKSIEVWHDLMKKITGMELPSDLKSGSSFGHLMGGYDAGYYGYLWTWVLSSDLFTRFQKHGLLNQEEGRRYRRTILEPGATIDPNQMVKNFLGRAPQDDAFFKMVGAD